jgi:AcrR family transcriptional regulator
VSISAEREEARFAVSRIAARLFLEHGVAGTSGDDIAAAAGLSKRTVWRYFRTKEACVEPLLAKTALKFASDLRRWRPDASIEEFLYTMDIDYRDDLTDGILAARLIATMRDEPALRSVWLMACQVAEEQLAELVRDRAGDDVDPFEIRLCAATIMAAIRTNDEEICSAVIKHRRKFTVNEVLDMMARVIRRASTLPICDPVA